VADLVGLCPTCHRATHIYYRRWLRDNGVDDFYGKDHARKVYCEAKQAVTQ
jgi:predicted HNH restriction endonuclease